MLRRVAREDPDAFGLPRLHAAHEPPVAAYHHELRTGADAMAGDLLRPYMSRGARALVAAWATGAG